MGQMYREVKEENGELKTVGYEEEFTVKLKWMKRHR